MLLPPLTTIRQATIHVCIILLEGCVTVGLFRLWHAARTGATCRSPYSRDLRRQNPKISGGRFIILLSSSLLLCSNYYNTHHKSQQQSEYYFFILHHPNMVTTTTTHCYYYTDGWFGQNIIMLKMNLGSRASSHQESNRIMYLIPRQLSSLLSLSWLKV